MLRGFVITGAFLTVLGVASAAGAKDETKATPHPVADQSLRDASFEGRIDLMAQAVVAGARIDALDVDGRTPLMFAAFNGHTQCLAWLLDRGAMVGARDNQGRTALMFASTGPFPEAVRLLLEFGSNPHTADQYEGWTSLMFAAGEGQLEVVQLLLDHGVNPATKDSDGDVAADHAAKNHHPEVEALLRKSTRRVEP